MNTEQRTILATILTFDNFTNFFAWSSDDTDRSVQEDKDEPADVSYHVLLTVL